MAVLGDTQQKIEFYLGRVRKRLRGLNDEDSREIVEELRSHILDRAAAGGDVTPAGIDAAIAGLGSPEKLAGEYMTNELLVRAEVSRSPLRILESLFHWASLSAAGFLVLLSSVTGYFLGAVFILCAALKPFHPQTAGLWMFLNAAGDREISFRLGFGSPPVGGRDLLGWWIVPMGLLAGCGLVILTTRFALWCARQFRTSHSLRQN